MSTEKHRSALRTRRRSTHGQSLIEFAMVVPILLAILAGTIDLGRFVADTTLVEGALRGGMRAALNNDTALDVGTAIRTNSATFLNNNVNVWGSTASGQADDCNVDMGHLCGDPGGCAKGSSFWTTIVAGATTEPSACLAASYCTVNTATDPPTCPDPADWSTLPWPSTPPTGDNVVVVVAVQFTPWSPMPEYSGGTAMIVRREAFSAPIQ